MQEIFNDPKIAQFFCSISKENTISTLQELILLGINVVNTRIHCQQTQNYKENINPGIDHLSKDQLIFQLRKMKDKINELAAIVDQSKYEPPSKLIESSSLDRQINMAHTEQNSKNYSFKITPKVTQTVPQYEGQQVKPNPRGFSRHHLDDSEVRKVLVNPYANQSPVKKKNKKKDKIYEHQEEVDQQALRAIKTTVNQKQDAMAKSKRSRTSHRQQFHAESKIKSLIQKDKYKFKQATTGFDFEKYQYSDEEPELNQNGNENETPGNSFSNYQQEIENPPPENSYEENDQFSDAVSQSSSFSKFSLGSQREVGRISKRKKI